MKLKMKMKMKKLCDLTPGQDQKGAFYDWKLYHATKENLIKKIYSPFFFQH